MSSTSQTAEPQRERPSSPTRKPAAVEQPAFAPETLAGRSLQRSQVSDLLPRLGAPFLQRIVGNQVVLRLIGSSQSSRRAVVQRAFDVSDPADSAEVEADRVSAAVVGTLGTHAPEPGSLRSRLPSAARVDASAHALGQVPPVTQRVPIGRIHRCPFGSAPPALSDVLKGKATSPAEIANTLQASSPQFATLRGAANTEVEKTFGPGKKLEYEAKQKGVVGPPAYYGEGKATFDMSGHNAQTTLNVVFETANASQAGRFQSVKADYDAKRLMEKPYSAYGVDTSELGPLPDEATIPAAKLSLIQEVYEWDSLKIARKSFEEIIPEFQKDETANAYLESSFAVVLNCKTFLDYYAVFGKRHREGVQSRLVEAASPKAPASSEPGIKRPGMFA